MRARQCPMTAQSRSKINSGGGVHHCVVVTHACIQRRIIVRRARWRFGIDAIGVTPPWGMGFGRSYLSGLFASVDDVCYGPRRGEDGSGAGAYVEVVYGNVGSLTIQAV